MGFCREADGSWRLIGSTFEEGLTRGTLTFLEYSEDFRLLHRTIAHLPVGQIDIRVIRITAHRIMLVQ